MAYGADAPMPGMMEPGAESQAEQPSTLSDEELLAIVRAELASAHGTGLASELGDRRASALDTYLGAGYGDEEEGRSSVVMRDGLEVVEWVMPDLMETFTAGDLLGRFEPLGPDDEAEAEQQTDLVNHVFLRENRGFNVLHPLFKDALLCSGFAKWWWEPSERVETEEYEQVTREQIAMMEENPDLQVVAATPSPMTPPELGLLDITVKRSYKSGRAVVSALPGEEVRYSRDARVLSEARFAAHVPSNMTVSKLLELGYPREQVEAMPGYADTDATAEATARRQLEGSGSALDENPRSDAERAVTYVEAYVRVDANGDGISELLKVCCAGMGETVTSILHRDEAPEIPMTTLCPLLVPHRVAGLGLIELVKDLQRIHTVIARQYLTALYFGNNPRHTVLRQGASGAPLCNIDQLMTVVPNGYVEIDVPDAIQPLLTEDVAPKALAGMEWLRQTREERTGVNRYTQGMEAPELGAVGGGTYGGLMALQGAANKRIKFIARIFAETGVRDIFKGLAGLLRRHQRIARTIKLRGQWVPIDPSQWKNDYDCSIEVGLGHGDKTERVANIHTMLTVMEKLAMVAPTLVKPEGAYEALGELCKEMGYRSADRFFRDPEGEPPPPPPPSLDEKKMAQEHDLKLRELEVKELDIQLRYEVEMAKLGILVGERDPEPPDSTAGAPSSQVGMAA